VTLRTRSDLVKVANDAGTFTEEQAKPLRYTEDGTVIDYVYNLITGFLLLDTLTSLTD
jgi:hypothetical protein